MFFIIHHSNAIYGLFLYLQEKETDEQGDVIEMVKA